MRPPDSAHSHPHGSYELVRGVFLVASVITALGAGAPTTTLVSHGKQIASTLKTKFGASLSIEAMTIHDPCELKTVACKRYLSRSRMVFLEIIFSLFPTVRLS